MVPRKARFSLFVPLIAALLACGSSSSTDSLTSAEDSLTSAPSLGLAANFAALGGAGVTCTTPIPALPATTVSGGDIGSLLNAPSSVTGFPGFTPGANRCSLSGNIRLGQAAAFANFHTAYTTLNGTPCPSDAQHNLSGNLGGKNLAPGFYCIGGVGLLTSQLTLTGGPADIWIFKAESAITPIGGSVVMAGGGSACNVYWVLGSSASFDATKFVGNVLAGAAITFTGVGSSLAGRALAHTNVTMTGANIAACTASAGGGGGGGGGPPDCTGKDKDNKKCKCKDKDRDRDGDHDRDNKSRGHGDNDCDDDDDHHDRGHDD